MTTPSGRALAGMPAVFAEIEREILRERVKAGVAHARAKGTVLGRPKSAAKKAGEARRLYRKEKLSKSGIARRLASGGLRFAGCWRVLILNTADASARDARHDGGTH